MHKAKAYFLLCILVVAFISAVVVFFETTKLKRIENEQRRIQQQQLALLPNALQQLAITFEPISRVDNPQLPANDTATAYRATINGETILLLIPVQTEAYVGVINSLVAVDQQGIVQKVNILQHQETLGFVSAHKDFNEAFLQQFIGTSLTLPAEQWAVKKDGGQFDHITGATVSSRAVIRSVHAALTYQQNNQDGFNGAEDE